MNQQEIDYIFARALEKKKDDVYKLSKLYYDGIHILPNRAEAKKWMECYIEIGGQRHLGEVTYLLGKMLYNGDGCQQDRTEAVKYFIKSYNENYSNSWPALKKIIEDGEAKLIEEVGQNIDLPTFLLLELGKAYAEGRQGMEKDSEKAKDIFNKLLQKAGSLTSDLKGNIYYTLGNYYENGILGIVDFEYAKKYYTLASDNSHYRARLALSSINYREEQAKRKAEAEAERARKAAEAEAERARMEAEAEAERARRAAEAEAERTRMVAEAEAGDTKAMYLLAKALLQAEHGFEKDIPRAMDLLLKAAEAKNNYADYQLGLIYKYGKYGQKQNKTKAKKHLQRAAKKRIGNSEKEYNEMLSWKIRLYKKLK